MNSSSTSMKSSSNSSNSAMKSLPISLIHASERAHPTVFQSTLLSAVLRAPASTTASTTESMQLSACTTCLNPWVAGVTVRVRVVRKADRRRFVNSVVYKCLNCDNVLALPAARHGALKAAHAGSLVKKSRVTNKKRPAAAIVKSEQKPNSNPTVKRPRQQLPKDKISAAVKRGAGQKPSAAARVQQPSLLSQFLSKL
jgi:RNase P subunit RPR2